MDELYIVTEVGIFGDLDIDNPTKKKVKKKKVTDDDINEAIKENLKNLTE